MDLPEHRNVGDLACMLTFLEGGYVFGGGDMSRKKVPRTLARVKQSPVTMSSKELSQLFNGTTGYIAFNNEFYYVNGSHELSKIIPKTPKNLNELNSLFPSNSSIITEVTDATLETIKKLTDHQLEYEDKDRPLTIAMMCMSDDGIPMPITNDSKPVHLTAGEIMSLAGDFYTYAGWGQSLRVDVNLTGYSPENEEKCAFENAFHTLASKDLKRSDIDKIYELSKNHSGTVEELMYMVAVPDYKKKLEGNVAHFHPWSVRAYVVGHESALRMARFAHEFRSMPAKFSDETSAIYDKVKENPSKYGINLIGDNLDDHKQQIGIELANRYHAMAVSQEMYAMHFLSDHFASGHMSRMGEMRFRTPQCLGTNWLAMNLCSLLVNAMHTEDNEYGVLTTNIFTKRPQSRDEFEMPSVDSDARGDGTYFDKTNNLNGDMLLNAIDNSLGDITRLYTSGEAPSSDNFGALKFLPEVDYTKPQREPLMVLGSDKKTVYVRKDAGVAKTLDPDAYKAMLENPSQYGYERLTLWRSFTLALRFHVFSSFFSLKDENGKKIDASKTKLSVEPEQSSMNKMLDQLSGSAPVLAEDPSIKVKTVSVDQPQINSSKKEFGADDSDIRPSP